MTEFIIKKLPYDLSSNPPKLSPTPFFENKPIKHLTY